MILNSRFRCCYPFLSLAFLLLLTPIANAQKVVWEKQFSKDQANIFRSVRLSLDSNFIATGYAGSLSGSRAYSVMVAASSGSGDGPVFVNGTDGWDLIGTPDSGHLVVGAIKDGIDWDVWLAKLSKAGVVEWSDSIDVACGAGPRAVVHTVDGGYLIAGTKTCSGPYDQDYWLLKLDPDFGVEWEKSWSNSKYDGLDDISQTLDGGFVATGIESDAQGLNYKTYTVKLSASGDVQWEHRYGNDWTGGGYGVRQVADSGYAIAAMAVGADDYDNIVLIRLDKNGDLLWGEEFEYPRNQWAVGLELTPDGGFIIAGSSNGQGASTLYDVFALRTDYDGNEIWHKSYGTTASDYAYGLAADKLGYVIGGYTNVRQITSQPVHEAYLIKVADAFQTFTVRDALYDTIPNSSFEVYRVKTGPPLFADSLIATVTTNARGQFTLPDSLIGANDTMKVSKFLHSEPAVKHEDAIGSLYHISVDNAKFDSLGAMSYFVIPDAQKQHTIVLDHTTIRGNLVVSVEWDANEPYLQTTESGFRSMANYLYDVTDGQFQIDTIAMFDNGEHWDDADIRVYASNMEWPRATPSGWRMPANTMSPPIVHLPRRWFGNSDQTRNGTFANDPLDMNVVMDYRTRGHELGHYLFGFRDEYEFALSTVRCANAANYGFMDTHYQSGGVMSSEMSTQDIYLSSPTCQNSNQWTRNGMSCWPFFKGQYERRYSQDSIFTAILQPFARDLMGSNFYFPGPNDNVTTPNYDVGAQVVFTELTNPPSAVTYNLAVWSASDGLLVAQAGVTNIKSLELPPRIVDQGQTNDAGVIKLLGVNLSDVILCSGYRVRSFKKSGRNYLSSERFWNFGEATIGQSGRSRLGNEFKDLRDGNLELTLKSPTGNYPFVTRLVLGHTTAAFNLDMAKSFTQLPSLDQNSQVGAIQSYPFVAAAQGYQAQISNDLAGTGELKVWAVDDSAESFFVDTHYNTVTFGTTANTDEIFAFDGSARVSLDPAGTVPDRATLLTSRYPVPRAGLQVENLQAGPTQALALYPALVIAGDSRISIRYPESDLGDSVTARAIEGSLRIFRWDESGKAWNLVGGAVDTVFNEVTANLVEEGVYAAFTIATAPSAPCGDLDASGRIDISDAVYLINYIFASGPAPQDAFSGDVDCNERVDITDAVYLINYIFASGAAPCAACP